MKKVLSICLVLILVPVAVMTGTVISRKDNPEFLYVLSAKSGTYEGDRLTLKGVPLIVYFSDRPDRIAGHVGLEKFVEAWGKGPDSFKVDPPNAALSILDEKGARNVVVEVNDLKMKDGAIIFAVRLLKGNIPGSFGVSSMFIDNFGPFPGG